MRLIEVFEGRGGRGEDGYWGDAVPPDPPALRGPSECEPLHPLSSKDGAFEPPGEKGGVIGYGRSVRNSR